MLLQYDISCTLIGRVPRRRLIHCAATAWRLLHNPKPPGLMAASPRYEVFSFLIRRPLASWLCPHGVESSLSQSGAPGLSMAVSSRYEVFSFKILYGAPCLMAVPPRYGIFYLHNTAPPGLIMVVSPRYGLFSFKIWRPLVLVWLCRLAMKSSPSQSGGPWSYGCAATVWCLLHNLVPPGLMAVLPHYGVFSTIRRPLVSWVCRYGMASFPSQSNGIRYSIRQD